MIGASVIKPSTFVHELGVLRRATLLSTSWTAASLRLMLPVASGSAPQVAISSSCHVIVAPSSAVGRFLLQVRQPGTRCQTISAIRRLAKTLLGDCWRHTCLRCIRACSALEALRNALYKCSTYLLTYLLIDAELTLQQHVSCWHSRWSASCCGAVRPASRCPLIPISHDLIFVHLSPVHTTHQKHQPWTPVFMGHVHGCQKWHPCSRLMFLTPVITGSVDGGCEHGPIHTVILDTREHGP